MAAAAASCDVPEGEGIEELGLREAWKRMNSLSMVWITYSNFARWEG